MTEDELIGWHHRLNGHEFEQTLGGGEGQGSLVCCSLWGCRVGHNLATKQQHNNIIYMYVCTIISVRMYLHLFPMLA